MRSGFMPRPDWTKPVAPAIEADEWALHGQTTFLSQYALPFHAPYRGANSLDYRLSMKRLIAEIGENYDLVLDPDADTYFLNHAAVALMPVVPAAAAEIMDKLSLRSIAELTKYAIREGLTSLDH